MNDHHPARLNRPRPGIDKLSGGAHGEVDVGVAIEVPSREYLTERLPTHTRAGTEQAVLRKHLRASSRNTLSVNRAARRPSRYCRSRRAPPRPGPRRNRRPHSLPGTCTRTDRLTRWPPAPRGGLRDQLVVNAVTPASITNPPPRHRKCDRPRLMRAKGSLTTASSKSSPLKSRSPGDGHTAASAGLPTHPEIIPAVITPLNARTNVRGYRRVDISSSTTEERGVSRRSRPRGGRIVLLPQPQRHPRILRIAWRLCAKPLEGETRERVRRSSPTALPNMKSCLDMTDWPPPIPRLTAVGQPQKSWQLDACPTARQQSTWVRPANLTLFHGFLLKFRCATWWGCSAASPASRGPGRSRCAGW